MNVQSDLIPDNVTAFLELKNSVMHSFLHQKKEKRAQGHCQILRAQISHSIDTPTDSDFVYYIKINDKFCQSISKQTVLLRINYPNNTSYLFESKQGIICALSFHKDCHNLEKFETHFSQFAVILNFDSENVPIALKQNITNSCPANIETKDITSDAKGFVKKIGKNVGLLVGKISNYAKGPADGAGKAFSERVDRISRDSIGEGTKNKWNSVVEKSAAINNFLSNLMRPVINKYENFTEKLGEGFNNSENVIISNVREYSYALRDSLNEGEKQGVNKKVEEEMKAQQSSAQLH